jgi:hypothetical protein
MAAHIQRLLAGDGLPASPLPAGKFSRASPWNGVVIDNFENSFRKTDIVRQRSLSAVRCFLISIFKVKSD